MTPDFRASVSLCVNRACRSREGQRKPAPQRPTTMSGTLPLEREGRVGRGSKPMNSGEHRERSKDPFPGVRGSFKLEMCISRDSERRCGHWGGDIRPHCSGSWKRRLIQETPVTSGLGPMGRSDGSGHGFILESLSWSAPMQFA